MLWSFGDLCGKNHTSIEPGPFPLIYLSSAFLSSRTSLTPSGNSKDFQIHRRMPAYIPINKCSFQKHFMPPSAMITFSEISRTIPDEKKDFPKQQYMRIIQQDMRMNTRFHVLIFPIRNVNFELSSLVSCKKKLKKGVSNMFARQKTLLPALAMILLTTVGMNHQKPATKPEQKSTDKSAAKQVMQTPKIFGQTNKSALSYQ